MALSIPIAFYQRNFWYALPLYLDTALNKGEPAWTGLHDKTSFTDSIENFCLSNN